MSFISNKRGVAKIVAVVLISLLTLVALSVLVVAFFPLIKENLFETGSCLDSQLGVELVSTRISCYDSSNSLLGFTVKVKKDNFKTFRIALIDNNGKTIIYDIKSGSNPSGLGMLGEGFPGMAGSSTIQFPYFSQQLSYVASVQNIIGAEISPVVNGNVCAVDDSIKFHPCPNDVYLGSLPPVSVLINIV